MSKSKVLDIEGLNDLFSIEQSAFIEDTPAHTRAVATPQTTTENVYDELGTLITKCGRVVDGILSVVDSTPGDGEVYQGAASLINAQTSLMKEFTKVNLEMMKHRNQMEMIHQKHNDKIELEREKAKLRRSDEDLWVDSEDSEPTTTFSQEELIELISSST